MTPGLLHEEEELLLDLPSSRIVDENSLSMLLEQIVRKTTSSASTSDFCTSNHEELKHLLEQNKSKNTSSQQIHNTSMLGMRQCSHYMK